MKSTRGHGIYSIRRYSTLDSLLGQQWHLNRDKDFSFVILETVQYYLHRRVPARDAIDDEHSVDGGYAHLSFCEGDGVERNWEDITAIEFYVHHLLLLLTRLILLFCHAPTFITFY